ncbi:hypothetical protein [Lactococcus lactis]
MKLNEIEAVGRAKIFTGEMRVYKDMSEFNEYIEEVDVYTAEQMQEYAKECVREAIILNSGGTVSDDMIKRAIDSAFSRRTRKMTKFETANELISFVKKKELKRGFYQKGKRIQWLVGFDMLGFMQVTTPAQVRKSRSGFNCSVTNWNVLLEENSPKLDWFLSAKYIGTELEIKND